MFRKIVLPLDGSPLAEMALPTAGAIARESGGSIELVLVHTSSFFDGPGTAAPENRWLAETRYVEELARTFARKYGVSVTHAVPKGNPVEMIAARAQDIAADLIVMTSHGRTGFSRLWVGSVADGVIRNAPIPVLLLRMDSTKQPDGQTAPQFKRVLVPLDGSAVSTEILAPATDLARAANGRLLLLRIVHPVPLPTGNPELVWTDAMLEDEAATHLLADEAKRELNALARGVDGAGASAIETHVLVSRHAATSIVEFATRRGVDAIAMSTHGRGASRLLVGSVADKVLRATSLPLLILKPSRVGLRRQMLDNDSVASQLIAISGR